MKKISQKNFSKKGVQTTGVLQITRLDPDILRKLKIYEVEHAVGPRPLEHAEVFTKAFLLLLESEKN